MRHWKKASTKKCVQIKGTHQLFYAITYLEQTNSGGCLNAPWQNSANKLTDNTPKISSELIVLGTKMHHRKRAPTKNALTKMAPPSLMNLSQSLCDKGRRKTLQGCDIFWNAPKLIYIYYYDDDQDYLKLALTFVWKKFGSI